MKPIRLANAGLPDDARKHIASSVLRRVVRICLPAWLGTLVAWSVTQLRLFTYVPYLELNGMWLALGTPKPSAGLLLAIRDYVKACVTSLPIPCPRDTLEEANISTEHLQSDTTTTNQINGV